MDETINTLKYAYRARKIQNKPISNIVDQNALERSQMQKKIELLESKLKVAQDHHSMLQIELNTKIDSLEAELYSHSDNCTRESEDIERIKLVKKIEEVEDLLSSERLMVNDMSAQISLLEALVETQNEDENTKLFCLKKSIRELEKVYEEKEKTLLLKIESQELMVENYAKRHVEHNEALESLGEELAVVSRQNENSIEKIKMLENLLEDAQLKLKIVTEMNERYLEENKFLKSKIELSIANINEEKSDKNNYLDFLSQNLNNDRVDMEANNMIAEGIEQPSFEIWNESGFEVANVEEEVSII